MAMELSAGRLAYDEEAVDVSPVSAVTNEDAVELELDVEGDTAIGLDRRLELRVSSSSVDS